MKILVITVFVILFPHVCGHIGDVLHNVNEVIRSDLKAVIQDQSAEMLKYFNSRIAGFDISAADHGVVGEFVKACGSPLNRSICKEALYEHCSYIPELIGHVIEHNFNELNLTELFPLVKFYGSVETCGQDEFVKEIKRAKPTSAQAWGYGLGFVGLICFISNIGGFLAPCMDKRYFQRILLFCVALAVGTLAGTGMLVLIPESLHLTEDDSPRPDFHLKMSAVLGGVYFFYFSERLMKMYFSKEKKQKKDTKEISLNPSSDQESLQLTTSVDVDNHGHSHFPSNTEKPEIDEGGEVVSTGKKKKEIATVAWMILVGDALHNFVDGIAIGAAFTENVYLGVSVSLAVVCEELPHELGDIAILLHSGLSMKRSLCYNFLAACTCFLGLVIGILVGENSDANVWIFGVAGGMFVYISLVDMLPEMASQYTHVVSTGIESPATVFFIQNLGLICGYAIIFILVLYGGNINV